MNFTWLIGWIDVVMRVHEYVDTHVYKYPYWTCFGSKFGMFLASGILVFTSGNSMFTWRFWSLTVHCIIHEFRCVFDSKIPLILVLENWFLVLENEIFAAGNPVLLLEFRSMDGVFGSNTINCIIRYTGICMGVYVYLYAYCRVTYLDLYMDCIVAPLWAVLEA